jgi:hypothetical protein
MLNALEKPGHNDNAEYPVTEIYFGTADEREDLIAAADTVFSASVKGGFYLGETFLFAGRLDDALAAYTRVLETSAPPWDDEFKMLSASRAAEICGARGDYATAADWLGRADGYYAKEYLVDWILEGRRGYYKRLDEGRETVTPRLLTPRERRSNR